MRCHLPSGEQPDSDRLRHPSAEGGHVADRSCRQLGTASTPYLKLGLLPDALKGALQRLWMRGALLEFGL
jgi:hypothetical protein